MLVETGPDCLCFQHTVSVIGPPPRPVANIDCSTLNFGHLSDILCENIKVISL